MNRYRLYTGPTRVAGVAKVLRDHGFFVVVLGTEHVYFESWHIVPEAWKLLQDCHVTGFKYQDLQFVGKVG
jgi:hypothetical protein